jgi:hypothetical protein
MRSLIVERYAFVFEKEAYNKYALNPAPETLIVRKELWIKLTSAALLHGYCVSAVLQVL